MSWICDLLSELKLLMTLFASELQSEREERS